MKRNPIFILIFLLAISSQGFSQKKVFVITKTIQKEYQSNNKLLMVKSEKADVIIEGWEKNTIDIELKLISKNPNKESAYKDLNIHKYNISEKNNIVELSNYFDGDNKYKKISSNLSASYKVYVPKTLNINIFNIFGNIYLLNTNNPIEISHKYGALYANNCIGNIKIETIYADLTLKNISGNFKCVAKRTDLSLKNVSGKYYLNTLYGKVVITPGRNLVDLTIDAKRSNVIFISANYLSYNYNLSTQNADIIVPPFLKGKTKQGSIISLNHTGKNDYASIKVTNSYNPIIIKISNK